jgi:hypothetical protein
MESRPSEHATQIWREVEGALGEPIAVFGG